MAPRLFMWVALVAGLCVCGGHARAAFYRGLCPLRGCHFDEAAAELSQETAAGDPRAQAFLGYLLTAVPNGKSDFKKGLTLFISAAEAGEPEAEFGLGILYMNGVRSGERVLLEKAEYRAL